MSEIYPIDPEKEFEAEVSESTISLIANGLSQYGRVAERIQEFHTGSKETFLSAEEEFKLAGQIQAGHVARETLGKLETSDDEADVWYQAQLSTDAAEGTSARNKLVECNLRFASYFARASMNILPSKADAENRKSKERIGAFGDITALRSPHGSLEDRIQVANLALITAAEKFQPKINKQGEPIGFITYAAWHIHAALYRHVVTQELPAITLSPHIADTLRIQLKNLGSDEDIPADLQVLLNRKTTIPLNTLATHIYAAEEMEDSEDELSQLSAAESIVDENNVPAIEVVAQGLLADQLANVLQTVSEREAGVIKMRFGLVDGEPRSLDEIGMAYGVTKERIRQIESKTMSKLRHPTRSEVLRDYLDETAEPDAVNNLHGTRPSATLPALANLLLRTAGAHGSFTGVAPARPDSSGELENWQLSPREDWETPVRKTEEELANDFDKASSYFRNVLQNADTENFLKHNPTNADRLDYPVELIKEVNETCGVFLQPYHIEEFWNEHIEAYVEGLVKKHGDQLDLDKISLFFSSLLAERLRDDDTVTLHIPPSLDGRLHKFGANLSHGELVVHGNLGNYAGQQLRGLANMVVNGSVGDYAGANMTGLASLTIIGDTGKACAYGSTDGTVRVNGHIETLALAPQFEGDVFAGSIGYIHVGAPREHITITRN